jgi:hypothetical protein
VPEFIDPASIAALILLTILMVVIGWIARLRWFPRVSQDLVAREAQTSVEMTRLVDTQKQNAQDWKKTLGDTNKKLNWSTDKLQRSGTAVVDAVDTLVSSITQGAEEAAEAGRQAREEALAVLAVRDAMVRAYNSDPEGFEELYAPRRVLVSNLKTRDGTAKQRMLELPRFEEAGKTGVFLLVEEGGLHYVFPRSGLRGKHLPQIRACFDIRIRGSKRRFAVAHLWRPAICKQANGYWVLQRKGEVEIDLVLKKRRRAKSLSGREARMLRTYTTFPGPFLQEYRPKRVGLIGAPAKTQNELPSGTKPVELEENAAGMFLLVEEANRSYLLPNFGLNRSSLPRLSLCFRIEKLTGSRTFAIIEVMKAAVCSRVAGHWKLETRGEISVEVQEIV